MEIGRFALVDPCVPDLRNQDCRAGLRETKTGSVHSCVTSPPYWRARDYGLGPDQLGQERTSEEYVANLVAIFREVRRVLRDDGTLWLNIGDRYVSSSTYNAPRTTHTENGWKQPGCQPNVGKTATNLKPKNLVGLPWQLAFALRAGFATCDRCGKELRADLWPVYQGHRVCLDCLLAGRETKVVMTEPGWHLRAECVWGKPNPAPESVKDRPTRSHEQVFLFSKSLRYFYDTDAVRGEPSKTSLARIRQPNFVNQKGGPKDYANGINPNRSMRRTLKNFAANPGCNLRDVWIIPVESFRGLHYATFPRRLAELCILAGTPEKVCPVCGKPWKRIVVKGEPDLEWQKSCGGDANGTYVGRAKKDYAGAKAQDPSAMKTRILAGLRPRVTIGFEPMCACPGNDGSLPGIVVDPFAGRGTVLRVAWSHRRRSAGFEMSPDYYDLALKWIHDPAYVNVGGLVA